MAEASEAPKAEAWDVSTGERSLPLAIPEPALKGAGRGRAQPAESSFWTPDLSMVHAFYVYLSCFMTRHGGGSWWSCQLIDPSGWGVGGMAGHAGPPVGPASDVVLPLHSLKKRGAT